MKRTHTNNFVLGECSNAGIHTVVITHIGAGMGKQTILVSGISSALVWFECADNKNNWQVIKFIIIIGWCVSILICLSFTGTANPWIHVAMPGTSFSQHCRESGLTAEDCGYTWTHTHRETVSWLLDLFWKQHTWAQILKQMERSCTWKELTLTATHLSFSTLDWPWILCFEVDYTLLVWTK